MPCEPILCKTCEHAYMEDCDLTHQWAIFGDNPTDSCECYKPMYPNKNPLKILHIGDKAGVACIFAKYQKFLGHKVKILLNESEVFNDKTGYNFYNIPETQLVGPIHRRFSRFGLLQTRLMFLQRKVALFVYYALVGLYSRGFDVVHIHSDWKPVFFIRKPKIIEFHGSDLRGYPVKVGYRERLLTRLFLRIFGGKYNFVCSTPDLMDVYPYPSWLPNPVDREAFSSANSRDGKPRNALYIHNQYESSDRAIQVAKLNGWNLTILERKDRKILHRDMPSFLDTFDIFIDRHKIKSLSKTALEALSMGLLVVGWDGEIWEDLPSLNDPVNSAFESIQAYKMVIKK